MKKWSSVLCVLLWCLFIPGVARASSIGFASFDVLGGTALIDQPLEARSGTALDPDSVTLRSPNSEGNFTFKLAVWGRQLVARATYELDWDDGFGAPQDSVAITSLSGTFAQEQTFNVAKTRLGLTNGGTQSVLYKLEVEREDLDDDYVFVRYLRVTFVVAGSTTPGLSLDSSLLEANKDAFFSRTIQVSSNTPGAFTQLSVNRLSWNGLNLTTSLRDRTITVSGTPLNPGTETFIVSAQINNVAVKDATFTIRVPDPAAQSLTARPDSLPFTRGIESSVSTTINSSSGNRPTELSTSMIDWNGLRIETNTNIVTVRGTPLSLGSQVVTVSGRVNGRPAEPAFFTINVYGSQDEDDEDSGGACNAAPGFWGFLGFWGPLALLARSRRSSR